MPETEHYRLTRLEGRIAKHDKDLYEGNGKSAITTRIQQLEDWREQQEEDMNALSKKIDRLSWIAAVGVGIIMTLQFVLHR